MTKLKKPWSQMTAAEKDVQFKINIAHNRSLKKMGLNLILAVSVSFMFFISYSCILN